MLKDINIFASLTFPEVYPRVRLGLIKRFIRFINSPKRGLFVLPITVGLFLIGQIVNPKVIQWLHIPIESSQVIIDQRISNLATIFSITLVVIGWLLTNLAIKESLSFQLLFKRTYLYPIFYFVGTLISCLIAFSLLRHEPFVNLGNIVVAGTCLIIVALILITVLFVGFIKVVDSAFIYDALGEEVMKEVNALAKVEILTRRSRTMYKEKCESLNLEDRIGFNTDLSNHVGINITPPAKKNESNESDDEAFIAFQMKYEIYDMNLEMLEQQMKKLDKGASSYYKPLQIGSNIPENFFPFYVHDSITLPKKFHRAIKKIFSLRTPREKSISESTHLNYFNERFKKDVKEGKSDNIQKGLAIYGRIFDLEDKIYSKC